MARVTAIRRVGRSLEEQLADRLLLLYTLKDLNERGARVYATALQKLVFLAEREMLASRIKGFNYNFVRLDFGPYSSELKKDLVTLMACGLVKDDPERGYVITEKGKELLERLRPLLERNDDILDIIRSINERYGHMSLDELLSYVYSLPRPLKGPKEPIEKVKLRTPLLRRINASRAKKVLAMEPRELRLLSVATNPEVEELKFLEVNGHEVVFFRYRASRYYTAIVLDLPGCISQGASLEEAEESIREAIECYRAGEEG